MPTSIDLALRFRFGSVRRDPDRTDSEQNGDNIEVTQNDYKMLKFKRRIRMQIALRLPTLALGLALGMAALPIAHSDMHGGMTVLMKSNFVMSDPANLKWERSKSTPWGMRIVVLYGDPSKPGPYVFRVKMPSGYKLPPHRHSDVRNVTVLKGTYWTGVGEQYDAMKMHEFEPGAFYVTEAEVPHYAWARREVIIQEMGTGPNSDIRFVNPDDDPRN